MDGSELETKSALEYKIMFKTRIGLDFGWSRSCTGSLSWSRNMIVGVGSQNWSGNWSRGQNWSVGVGV